MSVATQLLGGLVDSDKGVDLYIKFGIRKELFYGPHELELFAFISNHVVKYGKLPSRETLKEQGLPSLPTELEETPEYYSDRVKERHLHMTMKSTLGEVASLLNEGDPAKALEITTAMVLDLTRIQHASKLVDFVSDGVDLLKKEYKKKMVEGSDYGLRTGWPTLDSMSDGFSGGDLISIVGRPASGKTYLMLQAAKVAWQFHNKTILFISMEMKPLPIAQRFAAMVGTKSVTQIKKAELATKAYNELFQKLESLGDNSKCWLVDGALSATVGDIMLLARQLKPDVIFIDGAYLVRSDNPRLGRWERLTDNLERMKGDLAEGLGVPVFISYQFNREVGKGKDGSMDLSKIAYTDAVGQLSSVVLGLGLSQADDSVEQLLERRVEILKGRGGEIGSFRINWRFDKGPMYMNFDEIQELKIEDLQYGL